MKSKTFKRTTVTSLTIAVAACLVGSISGTVAWYQYSTRASVAYSGASAHTTQNLQISLDGENWGPSLEFTDINEYLEGLGRADNALRPVTTGKQAKNAELNTLYKNPLYQHPTMESWNPGSAMEDYIILPLQLRVVDINGKNSDETKLTTLAKDVYLFDLTIEGRNDNTKKDISDAIRVHLSGEENNILMSKNGESVQAHGKLDLLDDDIDTPDLSHGYAGFNDSRHIVDYGVDDSLIAGYFESADELLRVDDIYHIFKEDVVDVYKKWNGEAWEEVEETEPKATVESEDELPVFVRNKAYYVSNDDKLYKLGEEGWAWSEYKADAESYAQDDALAITDDSNPYDLVGGTRLGSTGHSVYAKTDLPANAEVEDKIFVRNEKVNYVFNGTEWVKAAIEVESINALIKNGDVYQVKYFNEQTTRTCMRFNGTEWVDFNIVGVEDSVLDAIPYYPEDLEYCSFEDSEYHYHYNANEHLWEVVNDEDVPEGTEFPVHKFSNAPEKVLREDQEYFQTSDNKSYGFMHGKWQEINETLSINVTIYLEGWTKLEGESIWSANDFIGSTFNVGMGFASEAHNFED